MKASIKATTLLSFLFLLVLNLLYTQEVNAQYIIAGKHGTNDYYANPNKVITENYPTADGDSGNYYLDINGDGINDFQFSTVYSQSPGMMQSYLTISPLNKNQVVYGNPIACRTGEPMPFEFMTNDTIVSDTFKWEPYEMYMSYSFYCSSCSNNCAANFNITDTAIIGVRVFNGSDTSYGWIRVAGVSSYGDTLIDYACNKITTGINELSTERNLKVYPNPSNGKLTIQAPSNSPEGGEPNFIEIYNIMDEKVYSKSLPSGGEGWAIDLTNQAAGIYLYRVTSEKGELVGSGKLVIE